jgi:hypothetical protein
VRRRSERAALHAGLPPANRDRDRDPISIQLAATAFSRSALPLAQEELADDHGGFLRG